MFLLLTHIAKCKKEVALFILSGGVPGAGGAGTPGDAGEAADKRAAAGQSHVAGQDVLPVPGHAGSGALQADVPRLPVRYLRERRSDGGGECSDTLLIHV